MNILCKLGIHKWLKYVEYPGEHEAIRWWHYRRECQRCGKNSGLTQIEQEDFPGRILGIWVLISLCFIPIIILSVVYVLAFLGVIK